MSEATGRIKFFDDDRGYGFIVPDAGGDDVFFHITQSRAIGDHAPGLAVRFELGTSTRSGKSMALNVNLRR